MPSLPSNLATTPDEIAGYRVVRRLGESSYLCLAPGDRHVVLKGLDPDCIIKGQLHPSVKERLARVRELAHAGVTNLYSVERDDGAVWLVWEHADAPTLADLMSSEPSQRDVWVVARELILAVESLHARGIVHGAIQERNVIVERSRQVRLTHVSPLLYTDPADDAVALLDLFERIAAPPFERLADLASSARGQAQPLRWARGELAGLIEERPRNTAMAEADVAPLESSTRKPMLIAALLLALMGIAFACGVVYVVEQRPPASPPTLLAR
ncbi:MAG TPA: protein kinase [Tepidisphaeraceae bacterium]|nr:protein kinase [Tepidisphaeraceae bacterium]